MKIGQTPGDTCSATEQEEALEGEAVSVLMALGILATVAGALLIIVPFTWGSAKPRHSADAPQELEAEEWSDYMRERW